MAHAHLSFPLINCGKIIIMKNHVDNLPFYSCSWVDESNCNFQEVWPILMCKKYEEAQFSLRILVQIYCHKHEVKMTTSQLGTNFEGEGM